jgi:hypothetical protein
VSSPASDRGDVSADERQIGVQAERVYWCIADFRVEEGGVGAVGAGTVFSFKMAASRRAFAAMPAAAGITTQAAMLVGAGRPQSAWRRVGRTRIRVGAMPLARG